jgi:3-deoxy-D-manno-octulosonic-acid transferase
VSDRSFARWRRQPRLIGKLLGGFDLCLAQTELDAQRLDELGARRVRCCGNLKFAATAQVPDVTRVADLAGSGFDRPCWLAASTHAGEELMAGRLHQTLKPRLPGLLTVIVPRHPERSATIVAELTGLGLAVRCRSQGQAIDGETDILLGDTLGEMGLFLQLASVVFMGKSLYGHGGQNPLEPAGFGRAVLYGPNMENFIDIAERMAKAGAAEQVADEDALAAAVALRLGDHARLADDGRKALEFARSEQGVLDRVMRELAPFLTATEDCRARA